jgi:hypothetical protein
VRRAFNVGHIGETRSRKVLPENLKGKERLGEIIRNVRTVVKLLQKLIVTYL